MDDWMLVDVIHGGHGAILELLFGCHTDVAQDGACKLGKESSTRFSQEPCLGVKVKFEAARRLLGEPGFRLLGEVRGMIVKGQLDRRAGWISGVEKTQELNEFATAMAVFHPKFTTIYGRCQQALSLTPFNGLITEKNG